MRTSIHTFFATFFYLGYVPPASGSLASAAGALIWWVLRDNSMVYLAALAVVTAIGFMTAGTVEGVVGKKDPSCVVIDEVAGALIAFLFLPCTPAVMISAFFLFRAFDMFKIYPANIFERLPGSAGIMLDDIVAGLFTNGIMHGALWLAYQWRG